MSYGVYAMNSERASVVRRDSGWCMVANKEVSRCVDGGANLYFKLFPPGRRGERWESLTERHDVSYLFPYDFLS